MKHQSLKEYLKNVRSVQKFICVVPLGGWVLVDHWKYVFPVVGDSGANFRCLTLTMIFAGMGAILPWAFKTSTAKLSILLPCIVVFSIATFAYFHLTEKYVVSVRIGYDKYLTVSIGSERSQEAKDLCPHCTDMELLKEAGPYEDKVQEFWTKESINAVRTEMVVSYAVMFFLLNLIVGIFARQDQTPEAAHPTT